MAPAPLRVNRFGFAEYEDMTEIAQTVDSVELARTLRSIADLVVLDDSPLNEALSVEAEADFMVPLAMAAEMLSGGTYSTMELVSAACTVRYCGDPHMDEFPEELASLVTRLPR